MNLLLLQLWNLTAGMMGNKILNSQFGQGIKALLGDSIEAGQWIGGAVVVILLHHSKRDRNRMNRGGSVIRIGRLHWELYLY